MRALAAALTAALAALAGALRGASAQSLCCCGFAGVGCDTPLPSTLLNVASSGSFVTSTIASSPDYLGIEGASEA
jgi:hypothetical protein